ncbi:MAG: hypothetical protein ORN56_06120 [Chitinophagales bacterium]|nr:hypothetical protein [Chitinophagales bacterium]
MKKHFFFLSILLSLTNLVWAQPKPVNRTNAKVQVSLRLRNGDLISGASNLLTIQVSTAYGAMALPVENVQEIQLGLNNPSLDREAIEKWADQMKMPDPETQKTAFDALTTLSAGAIVILQEYMNSEAYVAMNNVEYTIPAAINVLMAKYGIDEKTAINDIVKYDNDFVLEGTCNLGEKIEVSTAYGLMAIPRNDVVTMTLTPITHESGPSSRQYAVMGNKNISANNEGGFLNTGIVLKPGQTFTISASGKVTLASLSGNVYAPDGGINGSPAPDDGGTNAPTYGALVFKIGEGGELVKAGTSYKGKATVGGTLYLAIYETVFNAGNSGSFKVKVKVNN